MPINYDVFQMLGIARIFKMSQWNRLPSGLKRRSHFTDPERLGSYRCPPPQHSHTSQSSEASTSPHSSQEENKPTALRQLPPLTAGTGISSGIVGSRTDASSHASSSTTRLPTTSPTSSTKFTLPPIALSSPGPATYTADSGNLPHKLGTDQYQTLQHESIDLATAYNHAQIYIADLDTQIQASHAENVKLGKERQRLTGKIEFLEAQLEELEHRIQQTQKHTVAKDAQYSCILDLSTRLQSQGAAESQARKGEQQEWAREKKSMQNVIESLRNEVIGLRTAYARCTRVTSSTPSPTDDCPHGTGGNEDALADSSSQGLIAEIEALRRSNARMEDALAGVGGDNAQLARYIEKLGNVEKSIQIRLQKEEDARGLLDMLDDEGATAKERGLTAKE